MTAGAGERERNAGRALVVIDMINTYEHEDADLLLPAARAVVPVLVDLIARARELQIDRLHQGIDDKLSVYEQIKIADGFSDDQVAYVGDDLPDLPVMRRVGLAIAVADAVDEIRECAHFVTNKPGGRGAAREAVELILKAQDKWREALQRFSL